MVAIPVYLKHNIFYREGSAGRFDVSIGAKSTMGKTVSTFIIFIEMSIFSVFLNSIYQLISPAFSKK
jgi:hypothetical protein